MNSTPEQVSEKDAKVRFVAGAVIFSVALAISAIVGWHMASPAKVRQVSYDDAIKQIAGGNVKFARFDVSKSDAEVTLALRNPEERALLTIPSSSFTDLTGKLNNAGVPLQITERVTHGTTLLFLNLVPLFLILGPSFAVGFWLMKKRKPATSA